VKRALKAIAAALVVAIDAAGSAFIIFSTIALSFWVWAIPAIIAGGAAEYLFIPPQRARGPALAVLLAQARKKTMRIWAEQSPFDLKDSLKRRGYRWSDGSDGRPRSWYVDVDEIALDDEIAFLKTEIYLRDVEPRLQTLTAFTRFSIRA
jgi:hypothetical protein